MRAGNIIEFIQPFIRQGDADPVEPSAETLELFRALMLRLCIKHNMVLSSFDVVDDDSGEVESHFEIILRIEVPQDKSYLHIVIYGQTSLSEPFKDICVNLGEHDAMGMAQRSYTYRENDEQVYRTDNEDRGLLSDFHFSYIDYVETYAELFRQKTSEWDAERDEAQRAFEEISNLNQNAELEALVGLNHLPVGKDEIEKLGRVLLYAKPVIDD
ncbi:MAG: hypothetical protein JWM52_77 [Candidatus Saccharibacteria bacterium]|nr:hypothetical protein [Candidatus Saccharibacteria bacterium]